MEGNWSCNRKWDQKGYHQTKDIQNIYIWSGKYLNPLYMQYCWKMQCWKMSILCVFFLNTVYLHLF